MILRLTPTTASLVGETAAEWQLLEKQVRAGQWTIGSRADEAKLRQFPAESDAKKSDRNVAAERTSLDELHIGHPVGPHQGGLAYELSPPHDAITALSVNGCGNDLRFLRTHARAQRRAGESCGGWRLEM